MKIRNAQPYIMFILLVGIIVIGFATVILMKPVGEVYNKYYNESEIQDDVYQDFYTRTKTLWLWTLPVIGIGIFLWGLIKAHQREGYP